MKKALLNSITLTFIFLLTMTGTIAQTPQDIAKIARASTVSLTMNDNSYGSGFFVTPDHIATSYHVIEGTSSGHISPVIQKEGFTKRKFPIAGITAIDTDNDLVILKVPDAQGIPLSIGDSKVVDVLDTIYVVGNPSRIEGTVTTDKISNRLGKYFLMSAPISPGSSGGAVLNERSEVIGISMGIIPGEENLNQNLNVAIPSNYLAPLVEKAKKPGYLRPLSVDGITGSHLTWGPNIYEFSLRNQRREQILLTRCLVLFYGKNAELICADEFTPHRLISAGSVYRIRRYGVSNVLDLHYYKPDDPLEISSGISATWSPFNPSNVKSLVKNYEVRILDAYIIDPNSSRQSNNNLKGVTGGKLTWSEKSASGEMTSYVFSLHNQLDKTVGGVEGLVIFYDNKGSPIHSEDFYNLGEIPAGKTAVVSSDFVFYSIKQLTKRVEIKILDFETVK